MVGAEYETMKRTKREMDKRPKWSFGKVSHWPSNKKPQKRPTFHASKIPRLKRVSHYPAKERSPLFTSLIRLSIATVVVSTFIFPFFIGIPILLWLMLKSINEMRHPKNEFQVEYPNSEKPEINRPKTEEKR